MFLFPNIVVKAGIIEYIKQFNNIKYIGMPLILVNRSNTLLKIESVIVTRNTKEYN